MLFSSCEIGLGSLGLRITKRKEQDNRDRKGDDRVCSKKTKQSLTTKKKIEQKEKRCKKKYRISQDHSQTRCISTLARQSRLDC